MRPTRPEYAEKLHSAFNTPHKSPWIIHRPLGAHLSCLSVQPHDFLSYPSETGVHPGLDLSLFQHLLLFTLVQAINKRFCILITYMKFIQTKLTSRSWGLLKKPLVVQLLKNSPRFTELKDSLPCPQEPSIGLYPEPDRSSPYHPIRCLKDIF
jgi:hypothetical protein